MERKKSGLLRYMMSFGGRGGVLSNPDLYLANLSTTAITAYWSPGADSYEADIATDAAFTSIVGSYTGTATSNTFTGLTADTQYYVRVRGTKSGVTSNYEIKNAFTFFNVLAAYLAPGLPYGNTPTTNEYATTELATVIALKSFTGGGPDLNRFGTAVTREHTLTTSPRAAVLISSVSYMDFASDLSLGTGAFTILIKNFRTAGIGGAAHMFSHLTDGVRVLLSGLTAITIRVGTTFSATMNWPSAYVANSVVDMIIECDGTNVRASITGGATWTNSVSRPAGTFNLRRMGASSLGANNCSFSFESLLFTNEVLTSDQRTRWFNFYQNNPITNPVNDFSLPLKNLPSTFITDPVNGYIDDIGGGEVGLLDVFSWQKNYSLLTVKPWQAPTYSDATLYFGNTDTNKVRSPIELGRFNDIDDIHHVPGMTVIGNKVVVSQFNRHYGANEGSNIFVRKSWADWNMLGFMTLPREKEVSRQYLISDNQYPQPAFTNTLTGFFTQRREPTIALPGRIMCSISDDGGGSFYDIVTVVDTALAGNWLYPNPVVFNNSGTGAVVVIEHVITGSPVTVEGISVLYTENFITYENLARTWSKNVKTSGAITLTELYANCAITDARSLTSTMISNCFMTQSNMVYGVVGDGNNTGYSLFNQTIGGALVKKPISFAGDTVVTGTQSTFTGSFFNAYHRQPIVAIYRGGTTWWVIAAQVNGGNWLPTIYQSTNNGDTWSKIGTVPDIDNTKQHIQFRLSANLHFNGDAGVFACSAGLSTTTSKPFVKDLASLL